MLRLATLYHVTPGSTHGSAHVRIAVYGSVGEEVAVLVDGGMEAGRKSVDFNGNGLASGRCFYRMTAGGFTESRKMVLVR